MASTTDLHLHLTPGVDAPTQARRAVAAHVGGTGAQRSDLDLLVSEVVTNAVRHGGRRSIHLDVRVSSRGVRVVVRDGGGRVPKVRSPGVGGGFGLNIVAALASAWGTGPGELWFELLH